MTRERGSQVEAVALPARPPLIRRPFGTPPSPARGEGVSSALSRSLPKLLRRAPLMRRQRHQAAVAPGLALGEFFCGQAGAALRLDRVQDRAFPVGPPLGRG